MTPPHVFYSRNFYLLLALLLYFICSPLVVDFHFTHLALGIIMSLIILICVNIVSFNKLTIILSIIFTALVLSCYLIICLYEPSRMFYTLYFVINSLFLFSMTTFVVSAVAAHQKITIDTLLGAICGYLLIGLTWSHIYLALACIEPNAFSYHLAEGTFRDDIQHFIYFSYITLTTVGYGDITPRTDIARAFSWIEAATGQIYLTVWISQLVAIQIAQRFRKDKV